MTAPSHRPKSRTAVLRRLAMAAMMLGLGGAVTGCASAPPADARQAALTQRPYELGGGDQLRVTVYGEQELTQTYRVSQSGDIAVPLIGTVRAAGRSAVQVQQDIRTRLAAGYLRDPSVTVEVTNARPVFLLGEVGQPGQYPYAEGLTGIKAVALAGGFTPRARQASILVTRTVAGQTHHFAIHPHDPVHPGDTIRVAERFF